MSGWRLTVRHGPQVERERYATRSEALTELRRRAEEIRSEGGLGEISAFRTYEPGRRVAARLEVSGPGAIRRPEAGLDVMGDGALIPYRGAIFKRRLEPARGESPFDAVGEALGETSGPRISR